MNNEFAFFALKVIEDLVLGIALDDFPKVVYANDAFLEETTCPDLAEAGEYFTNWNGFLQNVQESIQSALSRTIQWQLQHPKKGKSGWSVKVSPLPDKKTACCIFKKENRNVEILECWDALDHHTHVIAAWVEYYEELSDIKYLHLSTTSSTAFGMDPKEVAGKFGKDVGIKEDFQDKVKYIQLCEKVGKVEVNLYCDLPELGPRYGVWQFYFLGYSKTPEKRPRFLFYIQDFDELHRLRDENVRNQAELLILKKFFDLAPVCFSVASIFDNGTQLKFSNANPCFASLVAKTPPEVIGKASLELGMQREDVKCFIDNVRSRLDLQRKEFEFDWANRVFNCIGVQVANNLYCFLATDITQLKRVSEELGKHEEELAVLVKARTAQLEEALQVKGRFLATMSHEMRTPLTGISGALDLLSMTKLTQEQSELVKIISVCGQQLLTVINDVLDLSKMEENMMKLEMLPVDIRKVLEDSVDVVCFEAEKKNLEIILQIPQDTPQFLTGDPMRIRQVLVNLITNAVKFTGNLDNFVKSRCRNRRNRDWCEFFPSSRSKV